MNLVIGNKDDLRVFYEKHLDRIKIPFEQMENALKGWKIWRLEDDRPIAVIVVKDGHAHISSYGCVKVGIKRIKWALDKLEISKTTVGEQFKKGHSLAKRLGFHVEMTEKGVTHYVRIPNKSQQCA